MRWSRFKWLRCTVFISVALKLGFYTPAHAITLDDLNGLPVDTTQYTAPYDESLQKVVLILTKIIGLGAAHRPYAPASPLGLLGLDFGIELTLIKAPPELAEALTLAGVSGSSVPTSIPIPKVHLHKGLGSRLDVGGSFLGYKKGYMIWGADGKFILSNPDPEELGGGGLTWALRGSYTSAKVGFLSTTTYGAELLASRKLHFADPYIGAGYRYAKGKLHAKFILDLPDPLPDQSIEFKKTATAWDIYGLFGLSLRAPIIGLNIAVEGTISKAKMHTIGTKIGFEL